MDEQEEAGVIEYEPPTSLPRSLLSDPDLQAALAAHDFGAVFGLARSRAGISYSKIAAETGIKPERVGTLARGRGRVTSFDKIVAISDALRIPGRMIGLAARPWEGSETPAPSTSAQNGSAVQRRTVLHGLAASLPTLAAPLDSHQITDDEVRRLRARTARLRRLDDVLGGGDTYRVYLSEYQSTKALLKTCTHKDDTGRALLTVLAEQAQQAGWAASDSGRSSDAAGLYKESHAAACEAGDADLIGNALALLAYQASAGDRESAVGIATRSCDSITPHTPAGVRALLFERKAWACAVAGRARETERALSGAVAALGDKPTGPEPDWASWVDATELDIMAGRCWAELRRPLRAVPVLERALADYDDSHARDKALYLSWLADSYLMAGEVEQAAAVAGRALDLAVGVASVRPQLRLAPVLNRLGAHGSVPAVRELLERAGVTRSA
ncbi:XRE family transcriptional regulator [Streptomyces sp. NPDC050560]|uniref:XRE family transcriptional regulator n=1 Tax=Streptomyces sp. NPDC050560 TaxID=3365630 RepID=UPI0037A0063F